jgi:hypothetical protein
MLAYPQASQPGLTHLGPQWNAARSTHHRIAWLARESSKPGRSSIERWTLQASAEWSLEHLNDDGYGCLDLKRICWLDSDGGLLQRDGDGSDVFYDGDGQLSHDCDERSDCDVYVDTGKSDSSAY